MRKLLLLLALLIVTTNAHAITHVVQSGKNGVLSGSPSYDFAIPPVAGHILLSFSRADNTNAVAPSDDVANVWNTLFLDNGTHGVGVYRVSYATANGLGTSYHITWSTSIHFTHASGYIVETDFTSLGPALAAVNNGNTDGFTITSTEGTSFGMSSFTGGATPWEATLIRFATPDGWYIGYFAVNAGSGWPLGHVNIAGTTDYLIDTWNGLFDVASTDPPPPSKIKHKNQVY
jgi:hypothetical protein